MTLSIAKMSYLEWGRYFSVTCVW